MITFVGAILTLFLDRDAGPRRGAIQLPAEKDVERRGSVSLPQRLAKKASSVFGPGRTEESGAAQGTDMMEGSSAASEGIPIKSRRTSYATNYGTSYGYDNRELRRRRGTNATNNATSYRPSFSLGGEGEGFGLAQRLLLANEGTVFNISDLWVAAATAGREDDQYSQADFDTSVFDEEDDADGEMLEEEEDSFGYDGSAPPSIEDLRDAAVRQSQTSESLHPASLNTPVRNAAARLSMRQATPDSSRRHSVLSSGLAPPGRRFSVNTARRVSSASGRIPAIFAHTGLSETVMSPARETAQLPTPSATGLSLAPIPENKANRSVSGSPNEPFPPALPERPVSLMKDLPIGLIFQYFCLAMHGTACDQIFM